MSDERKQIECAMREKPGPGGIPISGHSYRDTEDHDNCHVTVSVCDHCGNVTVSWWRHDRPPVKIGKGDSIGPDPWPRGEE